MYRLHTHRHARTRAHTHVLARTHYVSSIPPAGDLDPVTDTLGGFRGRRVAGRLADALMFHVHVSSRSRGNSASGFVHYQKFGKVGREGERGGSEATRVGRCGRDRKVSVCSV